MGANWHQQDALYWKWSNQACKEGDPEREYKVGQEPAWIHSEERIKNSSDNLWESIKPTTSMGLNRPPVSETLWPLQRPSQTPSPDFDTAWQEHC